ncbi:hypothetical protein [Halococcus sp. AFM35]|uniref:hypothetical protein n=1 Tax=Halococcus sp. AFM35 TaxID=3421653 RepID=UPI003EB9E9A0
MSESAGEGVAVVVGSGRSALEHRTLVFERFDIIFDFSGLLGKERDLHLVSLVVLEDGPAKECVVEDERSYSRSVRY